MVITNLDQVSTAWLTEVLSRSGALTRGAVTECDMNAGRGNLTTWLGVYDLAYAMVLDWPTDLRRQWEMPVLARYHARLVEHGVQGYTWQRLVEDYRLCLPMGVYVAVEYCRGGINERWISAWLTMLQRSLTACDDLDCRALWQGGA